MKALEDYVEQKNAWNAIFGKAPRTLSSAEDRREIARDIDSELSPENLMCDGEISASQAQQKRRRLARVAEQLKKLDPSVELYEL